MVAWKLDLIIEEHKPTKRLAGSLPLGGLLLGLISMGKQRKMAGSSQLEKLNIPCGSVDHVPCCDHN